jgi:hypothetical protein
MPNTSLNVRVASLSAIASAGLGTWEECLVSKRVGVSRKSVQQSYLIVRGVLVRLFFVL